MDQTVWTPGDVSGSQTLSESPSDHLYAQHINEIRVAINALEALQLSGQSLMERQAIINGNFDVAKFGITSTSVMTAGVVDLFDHWKRWIYDGGSGSYPTITESQETVTPGELYGARKFRRWTFDGAGSGFGANADHQMEQIIEHGNRILCGNGKKVTVSFWARSSIPGKRIGFNIWQGYGTGGSPSADEDIVGENFTLTSTWTRYSKTITTNTHVGKTFGTDGNDLLGLCIFVMWGSGIFGAVVNSPGDAEDYGGAGTVDVAKVKLQAGDVDSEFTPRSVAEEEALCRRFHFRLGSENLSALTLALANGISSGRIDSVVNYPVEMAKVPTVTFSSITANDSSAARTLSSLNAGSVIGKKSACLIFDTSSATADRPYKIQTSATDGYLDFYAEI